ncbi:cupredoxin domain-containing protein [Hazenella sp. IB182357]|uniref:Cupredoxin domain-containing protein n=1 Tax=Polycladospora coralii TaxID=2771432 RepID=A0A926RTA9_9BACL|nr:cupredoxin domain-containing protein [Polycladospora coralii]MBD1371458.1 cupredoxin domain-containing protein [Polycladospora coralii]MBS7530426.1 cupredoxin domain-containing protein [Polycladospora coralii]
MTTSRQWIYLFSAFLFVLIGVAVLLPTIPWFQSASVIEQEAFSSTAKEQARDIHIFTLEHKQGHGDQVKEIYRFDPGTIILNKDEKVRIHIHGFHGKSHQFHIPRLDVRDSVQKGQITTFELTPNEVGTYELICDNHSSVKNEGPMIGYIHVIDQDDD